MDGPRSVALAAGRGAIAIAFVVIAWEVAATLAGPLALPHLGPVLGRATGLLSVPDTWTHIVMTAQRILVGYTVGLVIGVPLGVLLREFEAARWIMGSLIGGLSAIPFALLGPAAILWFGIGESSKISLAIFATLFVLAAEIMTSARQAPPAQPLSEAPTAPASADLGRSIIAAARLAFIAAVGAVLVSEMLAATAGLGYLLMQSTFVFEVPTLFAVVLIVAVPCIVIVAVLRTIERLV